MFSQDHRSNLNCAGKSRNQVPECVLGRVGCRKDPVADASLDLSKRRPSITEPSPTWLKIRGARGALPVFLGMRKP
jgi:hypothetical protein